MIPFFLDVATQPATMKNLARGGLGALAAWYAEPIKSIFHSPAHGICVLATIANMLVLLACTTRDASPKDPRMGPVTFSILAGLLTMLTWFVSACVTAPLVIRLTARWIGPAGLWSISFVIPNAAWWIGYVVNKRQRREDPGEEF